MIATKSILCVRVTALALVSASIAIACSDDSPQTGADAGTPSVVDSSTSSGDGASADGSSTLGDAASPSDAAPPLTCSQKLANPMAGGSCAPSDETKPCTQGCLTCTCSGGQWQPCTTSPSCFGG